MSEYVCELPIDGMKSFVSGTTTIPVGERVVRCGRCAAFARGCPREDFSWCRHLQRMMRKDGFCSFGRERDGND